MQPQQPPQLSPNPVPSNYLDQIAVPPQKNSLDKKQFLMLVGAGIFVILIVIMLIAALSGGTKKISLERLGLRLQMLEKVSKSSHTKLKSSSLRSINSNLKTALINANRDIAEPLTAAKIELKKVDKNVIAEESGVKLLATLEDARLNAVFDRTYAREMSYQLDTTHVLMASLLKTTRSTSLKAFLEASMKDLGALQKQFSSYSSANS